MKTNILGGCVVVTDSFIGATRERVTVAGTSSSPTHRALEHGEVFPTGRETGSELPTMANGDLICSIAGAFSWDHHEGMLHAGKP